MLLADSGLYFHLSRLTNSPEEYQYMQVVFTLTLDDDSGLLNLMFKRGHDLYLRALLKLLGLSSSVPYLKIKEFMNLLYETPLGLPSDLTFRHFVKDFQRDRTRSGVFHLDPPTWYAFAATRFLRFLATESSR